MGLDPSVWKPVEQVTSLLLFLRCLTRTLTRGESHRKAGGAPTSKSFYGFFLRHTSYFVIVHEQVVSEFPKFHTVETVLTFSSKQPLLEGMCTGFFII